MAKYAKTEDGYQKIEELNANKIDKDNPVATGSFSMGREPGSVIGNCSHAEGLYTTASGSVSHAEGSNTTASADCSHAEGLSTVASGDYSHAEGSNTTASADCSHAEGLSTVASGDYSHAEGSTTIASGKYSHTEGCYTTAVNESQHVQGEFNIVDTTGTASTRGKYAHIVGNGTSSKRSNAHTLDWDGNAWFSGNVYIGGTGQDDTTSKILATTDEIPNVDTTLTQTGQAADAKATGDAIRSLSKEIANLPQPDWNQNDDTQMDYVKNRPFYSETVNVTVENAVDELLDHFPVFAVGDTVTVNVDGVEHSLVAYDDEGDTAIGDTFISVKGGEGQLGWNIYVDGEEVYFYATEAHTVFYLGIVHHKLDKKYMPDEVLYDLYEAYNIADDAHDLAESAHSLANKAQTTANNAQTTANNAQTTANNAQTTANNKPSVISRSITIYDKLDVLDIQVGETFTVTKEGYMVDGPFKKGDIVTINLSIIDTHAGRGEYRNIIANAVSSSEVSGIVNWYDVVNTGDIKVYAVQLLNTSTTSRLSLVRLG